MTLVWEPFDEDWQRALTAERAYYQANGNLTVPGEFVDDDGFRLGQWVVDRRQDRKKGKLTPERIADLDSLGIVWDRHEKEWAHGIARARAYRETNGDLQVPNNHATDDGFRLGGWIARRRADRKRGSLTSERIAELDVIGMVWDTRKKN